MDVVIEALTRYGLPGAIVALFAVLYVLKDRELKAERDARIGDARNFNELSMKLQAQVIEAVNNLRLVLDEVRRLPARR